MFSKSMFGIVLKLYFVIHLKQHPHAVSCTWNSTNSNENNATRNNKVVL